MIPTAAQCVEFASYRLADNGNYDDPWTQQNLLVRVNQAYRELFDKMHNHGVPAAERTAYYNLPPYTSVLYPQTAGITDFGELLPDGMAERSVSSSFSVASVQPSAGKIRLTLTAPHGLSDNARVVVYGVNADLGANGEWFVTVPSPTDLTLNGSVATVTGTTATDGTVSISVGQFQRMVERPVASLGDSQSSCLGRFEWTGEAFRFPGATETRQLRIRYRRTAADLALTESTGIDGAKTFLGLRAAQLIARDYDRRQFAEELAQEADMALLDLLNPMVKSKQRVARRRPPFRATMGNRVHL